MKSSVRLGRIAGIEIGVHYSWLLAFGLITWSLARSFFPAQYPGWSLSTYWATGVVGALLLFAAVLIHELAHSFMATARGIHVDGITLFIFGGVSNMRAEANTPKTEFAVSVIGPVSSLVLAAICLGLWYIMPPQGGPLAAILFYLAYVNAILAVFNLIPGFPLDGGRVLRSIVWAVSGSFARATRVATWTGKIIAWGMIAYGMFDLIFQGNALNGLWIAFMGWFLATTATEASSDVSKQVHLIGVRVRDVMESNPDTVRPEMPVSELVRDIFLQRGHRAVAVSYNEQLTGIVTLNDVKHVPQERWTQTPVSAVMTRSPLYAVDGEDDLNTALKLLAEHSLNQVLVMHDGRLAGLLSRANVIRYLQMSKAAFPRE